MAWPGRHGRSALTSFHVAALYAVASDEKMDDFFRRLKANGVRIVDGNSVVRDMVARGEVKVGLTDTDDVNVAIEDGQPIGMVLPDRNGLGVPVMPNMTSLIANAPHPEAGKRLIDYLLSPDVEHMLAESEAVQIPLHAGVPGPKNIPAIDTFKPMTLDFAKAASRVEEVTNRPAAILSASSSPPSPPRSSAISRRRAVEP
jgi:iron(III) transport system substrate-binding protein